MNTREQVSMRELLARNPDNIAFVQDWFEKKGLQLVRTDGQPFSFLRFGQSYKSLISKEA